MLKIAVTGDMGVGKTTLINRLVKDIYGDQTIYGFRTKKIEGSTSSDMAQIHIYSAMGEMISTPDNCIAEVNGMEQAVIHTNVFETLGVSFLSDIPKGSVILMDEIGFLEANAPAFSKSIKTLFESDYTILSVIKPVHTPLLHYIRNHPEVSLTTVTEQNRETVYRILCAYLCKKENQP
ncbi:MAG: nucleoside-triphosphatase [Clostridiales bacterium]|jgi:nucleoside-triphosphatase|nr:nucleoside-triphosphatase [Clostridiales bacterium]